MDGVGWVSYGVIDFFIWVIPDSIDASIIATLNIRQQIITNHQSLIADNFFRVITGGISGNLNYITGKPDFFFSALRIQKDKKEHGSQCINNACQKQYGYACPRQDFPGVYSFTLQDAKQPAEAEQFQRKRKACRRQYPR